MNDVRSYQIPTVKGEVAASAATANLLVYIDNVTDLAAVVERAEVLSRRLPARLVILDATQAPQTAELAPPPLNVPRCGLMVGGLAPATVVALAQRTLGRTLPTCLWWAASKPTRDDVLLVGLAEFAKYLVLDTAQGTNSASAIADVSHVTSRLPKLELRDMAWNRVASWRDAVARLFDDPSATAELSRIIRLEVSGSSLSEALYLAGWLASRLGWSVTRDQRFLDSHGGLVTFISHVVDAEPQRLELIRLRSAAAEFSAQISEHGEAITCTFGPNGGPFQSYVVPFAPLEASQLIERSLFRKGNDELFDAALRIVRDLGEIS